MAERIVARRRRWMSDPAVVASVLGADYAKLRQQVAELETAGVDRIQWDIMEGHFVPDTLGRPAAVAELRRSLRPDVQAPPGGRADIESGTHATGGIHGNPRDG